MSSTNRGATRAPLDAYYTPDAVARACVATIAPELVGAIVLEPHAGGGAFVRALRGVAGMVHACDLNPEAPGLREADVSQSQPTDFFATAWRDGRFHWVIGNPPFGDAQAHVEQALEVASDGVGFLLRFAFLEGAKRRAFWRAHPPAEVHVLVNRPSFTGGATDSAAYGWFIWRKDRDPKEPTTMHWMDWRGVSGG